MIDLLFFLFNGVTACMLVDDNYQCNIEIYFVESEEEIEDQYYKETGKKVEGENHLRGFHVWLPVYDVHIIKIVEGQAGYFASLGCNVLWHELQHARGFSHDEMKVCPRMPRGDQLKFI